MTITAAFQFETAPGAALLVELDGTVIAGNRAASQLLPEPSIAGRSIHELSSDLGARWSELLARARTDGFVADATHFDSQGVRRHLQFAISITSTDARDVAVFVALDITAHKHAAQQRAEVDERQAAEQRLESLGLVAGGIAHDFNNLLVGVLAESSAAREDPNLSENTRDALRRIEAAARRMGQLTRQLLAYAGRAEIVTVPLDPDQLVGELRDQLQRMAPASAQLDVTLGVGASTVEADPNLLRQVILNLVSNAVDAAHARISVSTRVVSRDGAPSWQLEVADDGAGIDGPTLARIFDPFFSTKPGHHGLGLSAVHGIVRRLGGDIEVDTTRDGGSRFRVRLPIARGVEPPAPPRRLATEPIVAQRLVGRRVLVADDEPSVRATVRRLLERRGARVVVVADGLEAEQQLAAEPFDLVVTDVSMPHRTGHDVMASARSLQPGVPVVLMSGYTERLRGAGSEEEADMFLEKPFTARVLDAAIDEVLKGSRRGS